MRDTVISFLRRLHFPVMLMLTAFPPALLFVGVSAQTYTQAFSLCALCALACAVCIALPAKRQLLAAALLCAGLFALGMRLAIPVLLSAVCCLVLFASLRLSRSTLHTTPPVFYLCGVVSHLVTQFFLRSALVSNERFAPLTAPLCALSLLYLALLLLTFNGISLDNAALGRHRLPASVRRINALMTVCFLALALLLASASAVASFVVSLWHALLGALARLNALLMRLLPVAQDMGGGGMPGRMEMIPGAAPIAEPSFLAIVLERIAAVLAGAVAIAGGAFLLWRIFMLLRRLVRHVLRRLHSYVLIVSDDYVDEISDTREEDGEHSASRLPRILRRTSEHDRTPGGMIRARYAQLLRKHPQWRASSTARENLPQPSAALYERVRYSEHPVSQSDADRFTADTRRL